MSTDRTHLGTWIAALVSGLAAADPAAYVRLSVVAGGRWARITLDEDTVVAGMSSAGVIIRPGDSEPVDGYGRTSRAVVLAILNARLEAGDAVRSGLIEVYGDLDALSRIFTVIEILLDGATRAPLLRALADQLRAEVGDVGLPRVTRSDPEQERSLLRRLGVL
jgi:hypothetical protein